MIKNLIFDFGKVLVDYDFDHFFALYIHDEERRKAFTPVIYNERLQLLLDYELRPFDDIMEDIVKENPEYESEIRHFIAYYPQLVTGEIEGMRALLQKLKAEGYKLYGLTNWCSKVYVTMRQFDIFKLLDGQVISSEEHVVKPNAEIYNILLNRYNLQPQECLFTDDRPENIAAGEALGIKGIVFENARQFERELRVITKTEKPISSVG